MLQLTTAWDRPSAALWWGLISPTDKSVIPLLFFSLWVFKFSSHTTTYGLVAAAWRKQAPKGARRTSSLCFWEEGKASTCAKRWKQYLWSKNCSSSRSAEEPSSSFRAAGRAPQGFGRFPGPAQRPPTVSGGGRWAAPGPGHLRASAQRGLLYRPPSRLPAAMCQPPLPYPHTPPKKVCV